MFDISTDRGKGRLTAVLSGMWTIETVLAYEAELTAAARAIAAASAGRRAQWLIDLTASPVQPRAVAERLSDVIAAIPESADAAVAIVSPTALLSLQAKRVARGLVRIFPDRTAAEAWLSEV